MNSKTWAALAAVTIACLALLGAMHIAESDQSEAATGKITVNYEVDEECGTNSEENSTACTADSTLYPAVANDGYKFDGWYVMTRNGYYSKVTSFSQLYNYSKITLYAVWQFQLDVSYSLDNGQLSDSAEKTMWSNEITSPTDAVWDSHEFYAWSMSVSLEDKRNCLSVSNGAGYLTIHANSGTVKCSAVWYYNVEYVDVDDVDNPNSNSYLSTGSLTLSDATRDGYKFLGWYDADGNKVTSVSGGDAVVTAKWSKLQTYKITYELGGAVLSDDSFSSYYEGQGTDLPYAILDGYYFNGWLTAEGDYSTRIESVTEDVVGDLTLYPWFIDLDDMVGHGYVLKVSMVASQGPFSQNYEYTVTDSYYSYDEEKGFYVLQTSSNGSYNAYWTNETDSGYTYTYLGMQNYELDGKIYLCEVYQTKSSDYSEIQYIYDGWIPICIEFEKKSGWTTYSGTYTLEKTTTFDTSGTFTVEGYGDAGISVTGSGDYQMGDTVTLVATVLDGTVFSGWYSESGTLLSTDLTYSATIYQDLKVFAYNDDDSDYSAEYGVEFTMPHESGLSNISWTVYYAANDSTETYEGELKITFENGGNYYVRYSGTLDGTVIYGFYTVTADGNLVRTFTWTVNGTEYTLDLDIKYSDYITYRDDDCSRDSSSYSEMMAKVTSDDKYVIEVAKYIVSVTKGMTQADQMMVVLSFVQNIEYMYDSESEGVDEYFKYPLETLYEQNGDCEDTSILFCAIASAMGYRSAMLLFEGHMAGSVEITDDSVSSQKSTTRFTPAVFTYKDVKYYYCETTATGWVVGQSPDGYTQGGKYYIYPDSEAIMPVASNYGLTDIELSDGSAEISEEDIERANEDGKSIILKSDDVSVELSTEVLEALSELEGDMNFSFSVLSSDSLTDAQKESVGNGTAYLFTLTVGDTEIHNLGGTATITIKLNADGGSIGSIKVYYIDDDGNKELMEGATLVNGNVVFQTSHLSIYSVETEYTSEPDNYLLYGAVIAIAVVAVIGFALALRRHSAAN